MITPNRWPQVIPRELNMIGIDSNYFLLSISVDVRFGSPMGELSSSHHPEEEVARHWVPAALCIQLDRSSWGREWPDIALQQVANGELHKPEAHVASHHPSASQEHPLPKNLLILWVKWQMSDANRMLHHEENKFRSNIKSLELLIFIQMSISCVDMNSTIRRMRDQIETVDGCRCQLSYIILSHVSRLGIILLMHRTGKFPKRANHHQHAISERSWVDNMERCRSCLRASCHWYSWWLWSYKCCFSIHASK